jgi:hypothetical protein
MEGLRDIQTWFGARHNYITEMSFERKLMALAGGMSLDQIRFAIALLASIPFGAGVKLIKSPASESPPI